ncbi:hypothetical protein ACQV5M_19155 [Leptospira sp. SA-E8]|uniref:hypothetical protein n=1 Tax=Leptospira sp. SA-E8 TaxID=3422259 RepID=UPI003EC0DFB5
MVPIHFNVMQLETKPFDASTTVDHGSDIAEVHFVGGRLEVVVASSRVSEGCFKGLRITFSKACDFRMLDEADLARYWASPGFRRGHHILSVIGGGWRAEESTLQGFAHNEGDEWLIVTGNRCLSVFSSNAPLVLQGEFDDAA